MNLLLLCFLAAAAAAALVDDSNCRQHSSQKPSAGEVHCSPEVEAGGVVLLSKRSALSKAVFKHEVSDIDRSERENHTLGGVADHLSPAMGALANLKSSLMSMIAAPSSSTASTAKSSSGMLWVVLFLGCGLVIT